MIRLEALAIVAMLCFLGWLVLWVWVNLDVMRSAADRGGVRDFDPECAASFDLIAKSDATSRGDLKLAIRKIEGVAWTSVSSPDVCGEVSMFGHVRPSRASMREKAGGFVRIGADRFESDGVGWHVRVESAARDTILPTRGFATDTTAMVKRALISHGFEERADSFKWLVEEPDSY